MFKGKFKDIVREEDGFLRGPFGSALKKSLFVPKGDNTYKVYEQSVVLEQNKELGNYYISKEYFENTLSKFNVQSGDFLVSCSGVNYGAIYQLKGEIEQGVINQALLRIRLNTDIVDENYFLYYFREYIVKVITSGTGDSTIPNFPSMSVVKNIDIQLPDISIQRKIGNFLKCIDEKILTNKQINKLTEKLINQIYEYWFLQFEFPNSAGNGYKSAGGKMVWNEELNKKIPENWKVENLNKNSLTSIIKPGIEKFNNTKIYLATGDVNDTDIIGGSNIYYENRESRANMQPREYSVWFAKMKNTIKHIGVCNYAKDLINDNIFSTGFLGLNCSEKNYEYMYSFINSKYFELLKDTLAHGATQEAVNNDDLKSIPLVVPTEDIIKKYHNKVEKLYKLVYMNKKENMKLMEVKEFFIPQLMNAQIKFKK